jgi:hypothetical protein
MRTTNRKLSELSVGNNVIIPIPQYNRGPTDPRNILGVKYFTKSCQKYF